MSYQNSTSIKGISSFGQDQCMMPLFSRNTWDVNNLQKKRKLDEGGGCFQDAKENRSSCSSDVQATPLVTHCPRNFINIPANQCTFHTEDWKNKQTTIYTPLSDDVMVNTRGIEQISFASGSFHIGNEQNIYKDSVEGHVFHLWKYDSGVHKLYVCRSFLFTDSMAYAAAQKQLQQL